MSNPIPKNNYYVPNKQRYENNLFMEEYYSSSDVKIEFNGNEEKEISYIQYQIQEQLKPIYGYNSHTYDDIAVGTRIVSGSFKVPIKNPATLQMDNADKITDMTKDQQGTKEEERENFNRTYAVKMEDLPVGKIPQPEQLNKQNVDETNKMFLIALGYSNPEDPKTLRIYQKDHDLYPSGRLDMSTRCSIADEYTKKFNQSKVTLNEGTALYLSPSEEEGVYTNLSNECVASINGRKNGFLCVAIDGAGTFYVKQ